MDDEILHDEIDVVSEGSPINVKVGNIYKIHTATDGDRHITAKITKITNVPGWPKPKVYVYFLDKKNVYKK